VISCWYYCPHQHISCKHSDKVFIRLLVKLEILTMKYSVDVASRFWMLTCYESGMTEIPVVTLLRELNVFRTLIPKPKYHRIQMELKLGRMCGWVPISRVTKHGYCPSCWSSTRPHSAVIQGLQICLRIRR